MKKKKQFTSNPFTWPAFKWEELNSNDWSLYFQGASVRVKLKEFPKFIWAKITNQGLPNIEFLTEFGGPRLQRRRQDIEAFDFSLPLPGAYNFRNNVFFFFRKFTRQWKKGICKDSAAFESILEFYKINNKFAPLIYKSFETSHSFLSSPKDLSELFGCRYYSFHEAFEILEKKKALAKALSKDIVLSLGARTSHPILWLSSIPIGYVESSKPDIFLVYPEVKTEILRQIPTASIFSKEPEHYDDNFSAIETDIAF